MIKEMTVQELKSKLDQKQNFILLDVREQAEWDQGYIDGAKLMPLSCFQQRFEELNDPDAEIVIQCRSGKRSLDACVFLQGEGYSNLTNLTGGIIAWGEEGYEIKIP
jgi:rhodanese-related sulfurtransferase